MNSARPPIFSHGTGPPRPFSGGPRPKRLSALRSRLSPIRNRWSAGTFDRPEIVAHALAEIDRVIGRPTGQSLADDRQPAIFAPVHPDQEAREFEPAGDIGVDRDQCWRPALRAHRASVEDQAPAAHLDRVAGKADHALDIIVALAGRGDDDDVAALRHLAEQPAVPMRQDVEARADPRPAVGIFADHQPVALQQHRHHRFRRDVEGLGGEAVERQHGDQHPQQALDLAPHGRALALLGLGRRRGRLLRAHLNIVGQSGLHLACVKDDKRLRPGVIVGHGQMYVDRVARRRKGVKRIAGAAGQLQRRSAGGRVDDADVLHEHAALEAGADRLGEGFLGGEALGQRARRGERAPRRLGPLDVGEHPVEEAIAEAVERILDPLDVAQVGADADDHRAASISSRIRRTLARGR